jgi:hypothetical protein
LIGAAESAGTFEASAGAGSIYPLGGAVRWWAERGVRGDVVVVAVGGDGLDLVHPRRPASGVTGRLTSGLSPRFAVSDGSFGEGVGSLFDELAALVESVAHLVGHGAGGFGDESDDQPGRSASAAGAGTSCGGAGESVVQNGSNVIGVIEGSSGNQSR